jgi:hypothetical protein
MISLTRDEEAALIPILKGMSETSKFPITLEHLVEDWTRFSR